MNKYFGMLSSHISFVAFRFRAISQLLERHRLIERRHHCNWLHFYVLRAALCFYAFATIDIHFARANVCRKRKEIWSALSQTGTRWIYYSANMARIRGKLDGFAISLDAAWRRLSTLESKKLLQTLSVVCVIIIKHKMYAFIWRIKILWCDLNLLPECLMFPRSKIICTKNTGDS